MIPSYRTPIEPKSIKVEDQSAATVAEQLARLQEQVVQLTQIVEYLNRERTRMKSDLDALANFLRR